MIPDNIGLTKSLGSRLCEISAIRRTPSKEKPQGIRAYEESKNVMIE